MCFTLDLHTSTLDLNKSTLDKSTSCPSLPILHDNSADDQVSDEVLTCNGQGDHLADDAPHAVPGDALVAPSVILTHGLDLVEVFGRKLGDKVSVF